MLENSPGGDPHEDDVIMIMRYISQINLSGVTDAKPLLDTLNQKFVRRRYLFTRAEPGEILQPAPPCKYPAVNGPAKNTILVLEIETARAY